MFKAGVDGACAEDLAKLVEANLFANVELDQDEHGAAERRIRRLGGYQCGQGLGGNLAYDWGGDCGFTVHDAGALKFAG